MKTPIATLLLLSAALIFNVSCTAEADEKVSAEKKSKKKDKASEKASDAKLETATLGAGCYWCIEAVLERTDGVKTVVSGFTGGHIDDPSYRAVCSGTSGHAEVVQLKFDPEIISYEKIVDLFWKVHDPTTLNRQGADVGTQYRSAIFYHSDEQKKVAEASKKAHAKDFDDPIVTEIVAASKFYIGPDYHQNFLTNNPTHGNAQYVIWPKLKKLGLEKKKPVEK
ncbi:MAG: peptide-methionine (S)-S-oxide reductase [Pseudoalteromonas tetraodonis]|jgi:peptide-methionine (S)-S-oxide reductase